MPRIRPKRPATSTRLGAERRRRTSASSGGLYHVQFGLFELSPGSPFARALGCSCPQHDGTEMFACNRECAVHDLELLMSALNEASESSIEFDRT
jgi:hypothetical protein